MPRYAWNKGFLNMSFTEALEPILLAALSDAISGEATGQSVDVIELSERAKKKIISLIQINIWEAIPEKKIISKDEKNSDIYTDPIAVASLEWKNGYNKALLDIQKRLKEVFK